MVKINFNCNVSRIDRHGMSPITVSIFCNGMRKQFALPKKADPLTFVTEMESDEENVTKSYVNEVRQKIESIVRDMEDANLYVSPDEIKKYLDRGHVSKVYTVADCFADVMDLKKDEAQAGYIKSRSRDRYIQCLNEFLSCNHINGDFPASDIKVRHFQMLQIQLKKRGYQQNTIYTYLAKARAAFRYAFLNGKIPAVPYAAFKFNKGEDKEIIYLTEEELQTIRNHNYISPSVRDKAMMFLVQCYCGMAIADFQDLKKEDFEINEKGQICINKKRKKTGKRFTAVVLKEGRKILEEYNYELPKCCTQVYNRQLKIVAEACGIKKNLHSHLARTTYICLLYNHGVSVPSICKTVGDSAKVILKYYAELDNSRVYDELGKAGLAVTKFPDDSDKIDVKFPFEEKVEVIRKKK